MSHFSETYVYENPQAYLGSYQTSVMEYFLQNLGKYEQIGPKILLAFRKINWEFTHWLLKGT